MERGWIEESGSKSAINGYRSLKTVKADRSLNPKLMMLVLSSAWHNQRWQKILALGYHLYFFPIPCFFSFLLVILIMADLKIEKSTDARTTSEDVTMESPVTSTGTKSAPVTDEEQTKKAMRQSKRRVWLELWFSINYNMYSWILLCWYQFALWQVGPRYLGS